MHIHTNVCVYVCMGDKCKHRLNVKKMYKNVLQRHSGEIRRAAAVAKSDKMHNKIQTAFEQLSIWCNQRLKVQP